MSLSISVHSEYPSLPLTRTHTHVMCSIQANPPTTEIPRTPVDIVAVVDISGSMKGEKLKLVKLACQFIIQELNSSDHFSLVSYDTNVYVDYPMTSMGDAEKEEVLDKVEQLKEKNSTNLCGGLIKGIEMAQQSKSGNSVSSVWLFTDGQANVGYTKINDVVSEMKKVLGENSVKTVYTFGFGNDHAVNLLMGIANAGNGMYYYIKDTDSIGLSFADCLGGILTVVAQDIQVKVECLGSNKLIKMLGVAKQARKKKEVNNDEKKEDKKEEESKKKKSQKKEAKKLDDETKETNDDVKTETIKEETKELVEEQVEDIGDDSPIVTQLGDIMSEESRDIICLVNVSPSDTETTEDNLFIFTVTYYDVQLAKKVSQELVCIVKRAIICDKIRNILVDKQINRLKTSEVIKNSLELARAKSFVEARAAIDQAIKEIEQSVSGGDRFCQLLVEDLLSARESIVDEKVFKKEGEQKMNWIENTQTRQRKAGQEGDNYETKSKFSMKKKWNDRKEKPIKTEKKSKKTSNPYLEDFDDDFVDSVNKK